MLVAGVLFTVTILGPAGSCYGASAHARSAHWWYNSTATNNGSNYFERPSSVTGANMNWTDGKNTADNLTAGPTKTSEKKFTQGLTGTNGSTSTHIFTGFSSTLGPGNKGSTAITSGSGASTVTYHPVINDSEAAWTVIASGTLGATPGAFYDSDATGTDPWPITADDLSVVQGSQYDLWMPFEISGGNSLGSGPGFSSAFGYDLDYATASGTTPLMQVNISGGLVTVSGDAAANFSLFLINSLDAAPQTTNPVTFSQLQNILAADLASDNTIDTPIALGLRLTGLAIPTTDLGDGSVAVISESARAVEDKASVPEPSTWVLFATAMPGLLGRGRSDLLPKNWSGAKQIRR
jgi:hypothetical protein